ncbi:hypothetical protein AB6A40_003347 [Gnathostoma spinigerum]|uniref:Calponin-homology (CH) domain-containing protein n=1 Tax=Gnathostoma spinigerum TaxID=75299 RepID=A0ABD6E9F8_9BILA
MFEEAVLTGVLNLSHRKLKEFPVAFAMKHDISDVVSADLSENRLSELPACMCELSFMETLRVQRCALRSIPPNINSLHSLSYLDLSGNQLSSIPVALFSLNLSILILAGNQIEHIPREIRQMADCLRDLDASCNRLRSVPADLSLLKSLRVLNLRNNRLKQLPSEISRLQLRSLDISENELTDLPTDLRFMQCLVELKADSNPIFSPPVQVCAMGREHIFKWLQSKADVPDGSYHSSWSVNQANAASATLRRGQNLSIEQISRRIERRPRATRFNTLVNGLSESGYASALEEQRAPSLIASSSLNASHLSSTSDDVSSTPFVVGVKAPFSCSSYPSLANYVPRAQAVVSPLTLGEYAKTFNEALRNSSKHEVKEDLKSNTNKVDVSNNNRSFAKGDAAESSSVQTNDVCCCYSRVESGADRMDKASSPIKFESSDKSSGLAQHVQPQHEELRISGTTGNSHSLSPVQEYVSTNDLEIAADPSGTDETVKSGMLTGISEIIVPPILSMQSGCKLPGSVMCPIVLDGCDPTSVMNAQGTPSLLSKPNGLSHSATGVPPSKTARTGPTKVTAANESRLLKKSDASTLYAKNALGRRVPRSKSTTETCIASRNTAPTQLPARSSINRSSRQLIENMKKILEDQLELELPSKSEELASSLADGVYLCNFANRIRVRAVSSIFSPVSPDNPLSLTKCRRNVDNFFTACRRLGLTEASLCDVSDVMEGKNLHRLAKLVVDLNRLTLCSVNRCQTLHRSTNV